MLIYSIIGSTMFSILGVIATYYRDEKPSGKSIGRDFIAGALIVLFLNVFMPSLFPTMSLTIPGIPTIQEVMSRRSFGGGGNDYDLQL
jgi:hypothetical protein